MNPIIISEKPLHLSIGAYTLHISREHVNQEKYYLPASANPFLIRGDKEDSNEKYLLAIDINYSIQVDKTFVEPNENLIASSEHGPFPYCIYRLNTCDYLWIRKNKYGEFQFVFEISENWSRWKLIADCTNSLGIDSFNELAYIFAYSVLNKGGILFHGVVMEWEGMGIIVCAHSGVGKSTHTKMWKENEKAQILNGDRALCYMEDNLWYTCGAPWSGSSNEVLNQSAKLMAVVVLEQSESNEISVLTPLRGALELIPLAFAPSWDETLMNNTLDTIDTIVQNAMVIKLKCRPELDAVQVLKAGLEELLALV